MILTCIESPLAGDFRRNIRYAQLCMLDSLRRGEAPYLSHLLYPQVFDDLDADQRRVGMQAGQEWLKRADVVALYLDLGFSMGMRKAEALAIKLEKPTTRRHLALTTREREQLEEALKRDPMWWATREEVW